MTFSEIMNDKKGHNLVIMTWLNGLQWFFDKKGHNFGMNDKT